MRAMRIFCVAIFALLLTSCTKQGYSDPVCGFAQIINWLSWGAFTGFEEEVCGPTQTAAATPARPSGDPNSTAQRPPGNTPLPNPSSTPAKPTTATADPCAASCPVGSFCEVRT